MDAQKSSEEEKVEILDDLDNNSDIKFKIIVLGNSGVGKSCISLRLSKNVFEDTHLATIGFEFYNFKIKYKEKIILLQLWDTCGQEYYKSLIKSYFKGAAAAFIVYAVDDYQSFQMVDNWINAVKTNANSDTLLCLLGNKNDLEERRVVSKRENAEKGTQFECFFSQEVSAKTGYNVKETFIEIAKTLYNRTLAAPKEPENYINISICQTIGRRLTFSKKKEGTTDADKLNLSNPELDEGDVIHKVHENKKRKRNNNLCCA